MKTKIIFLASLTFILFSCKRDHGCQCTDNTSSFTFVIHDTKKSAEKKCKATDYHENGTCTLLH